MCSSFNIHFNTQKSIEMLLCNLIRLLKFVLKPFEKKNIALCQENYRVTQLEIRFK